MPPNVQARWVPSNNGQVPPNTVEGGYQDGNKTFVGRALHDGQLVPGEVFLGGSTALLRLATMALVSGQAMTWMNSI